MNSPCPFKKAFKAAIVEESAAWVAMRRVALPALVMTAASLITAFTCEVAVWLAVLAPAAAVTFVFGRRYQRWRNASQVCDRLDLEELERDVDAAAARCAAHEARRAPSPDPPEAA